MAFESTDIHAIALAIREWKNGFDDFDLIFFGLQPNSDHIDYQFFHCYWIYKIFEAIVMMNILTLSM